MDLFKNEVGRPSNETLKKRRNFKIFISVFAVVAVLLAGFGVYKVLAPSKIEGEGLNVNVSSDNKFVLKNEGNHCYMIIPPKNAKNWKFELKYKKSGSLIWKTKSKSDTYPVGVENFCLTRSGNGVYRVLVKWTKGKNDLTYSSPNKWKPDGWKTNLLTGWAYKDISFNANASIQADIKLKEPIKTTYKNETEISISISHTGSTKLYYMQLNDYGGMGDTDGCHALNPGETHVRKFTTNPWYGTSARFDLFSSSDCSDSSRVDFQQTKVYKHTKK